MRLRTFTAPDMPAAMKLVREALGEEAVILSSEVGKGKREVTVTAAVEESDQWQVASDKKEDKLAAYHLSPATESLRFQLQELLRFHNLPELFIARLLTKLGKERSLKRGLEQVLEASFRFEPIAFKTRNKARTILMLAGPPGIGKTLTVARMAAAMAMAGQTLAVITTDNKRAGGVEQLKAFTDILGIVLHVAAARAELAQHVKATQGPVLIDTAGCNPYDNSEIDELASYASLPGIEPVLALAAGGDSLESIDTVEPFMRMPIKRLLITRTDTARRFGGILAAAAAHELAFCNASCSSSIKKPLDILNGARMAQLLLQYQQ